MDKEIWVDIIGFEGLYAISNHGRLWSYKINGIKKAFLTTKGYISATLHKSGKTYNYNVHRGVATYFVKGKRDGYEVNHIDGNKENNYYKNLEWVSKQDNMLHAKNNGLVRKGDYSKPKLMKPLLCYARDGSFIGEFDSAKRASEILKLDSSGITKVAKGKLKSIHGYKFVYKV